MQFGDFVGNADIKARLSSMVDAGHFPHALLLEGEPGSGRKTLAMTVARAAVCRGDGEKPCGTCAACIKSAHPDITLYGGDGKPISVDTVRDLRQEAFILPNESPYRVMILADAQTMTPQAQNALLKILEEPPAHALFFLTCENRAQLFETIRSRTVCLTLQPVGWEDAAPLLQARLPQTDPEQLRQAHALFGGRIGRVLDGVTDGTFRRATELIPRFALALIAPQELDLLLLTGELEKDRELTAGVLAGLQVVLRDALAIRYGSPTRLSTAPQAAQKLANRLPGNRLMALTEQTEALGRDLERNMNNTLFLTRMAACLRRAAGN